MAPKCGRKVFRMKHTRRTTIGASVFYFSGGGGRSAENSRNVWYLTIALSHCIKSSSFEHTSKKTSAFRLQLRSLIVANHFLAIFHSNSLIHSAHDELRITGAVIGSYLLFKCRKRFFFRATFTLPLMDQQQKNQRRSDDPHDVMYGSGRRNAMAKN